MCRYKISLQEMRGYRSLIVELVGVAPFDDKQSGFCMEQWMLDPTSSTPV